MPGIDQYPYQPQNITPIHKSELFSSQERHDLLEQAVAEQDYQLPAEQEQQVEKFAQQLEKITYPADIENLGLRLGRFRIEGRNSN